MCKDDDERRTDDMSSLFSLSSDERTNGKRDPPSRKAKVFFERNDLFSKTNLSLSLLHKKNSLLFFLLLSLLGLYYYDSVGCVRGSSARKYDDALETTG